MANQFILTPVVAQLLGINMVTGCGPVVARDINTEPGQGRNTDPDKVLRSTTNHDATMTPGGPTHHLDCHGPDLAA